MSEPKTLLVSDDDKKFRFGLTAILRRAGYTVLAAGNETEGLQQTRENLPDAIMSDVMLPTPDGIELKKELSGDPLTRDIPFIFFSAKIPHAEKQAGYDLGADDYIIKQFNVDDILTRVEVVLENGEIRRNVQDSS